MEPEKIESIEVTFRPSVHKRVQYNFTYTVSENVVYHIHGDYLTKCLINGKPYYCGSSRTFTKNSFDSMMEKLTEIKPVN